ncbi:MAG: hypothetical protein ACRC5H_06750, partial [Treponemataceae bacterium]
NAQISFSSLFTKNRELFVIKTQYFDLIFPEESRETALLLANMADEMYLQVATNLQTTPKARFPVVISPDTDRLNGYYMPIPYNRIVIFDTIAREGSLDVNKNPLFSTFLHELTHAVSANIKSPFWQGLSAVMGDTITPSLGIHLPTSFIEGVTVSFESEENYSGRLNDAYSMQILIRAKREKKFPFWSDVAGARDTYPGGSEPYIFGGSFAAFIQQKYGMEKYAQFWHESGKPQFFKLAAGIYKKVYGISLKNEWKNFYDAIPDEDTNDSLNTDFNSITQGLINTIAVHKNHLIWVDHQKKGVFSRQFDAKAKTKKLFSADNTIDRLTFSQDGRYIGVSSFRATKGSFSYQNEFRLFDLKKKSFIKTIKNLTDADIYIADDESYILGTQTNAQRQTLTRFPYHTKTKKTTIIFQEPQPLFTTIYSPLILDEKYYAFIQKNAEQRSIIIQDEGFDFAKKITLSAESSITPRFLIQNRFENRNDSQRQFYFSWNKENRQKKESALFDWVAEASTMAGKINFDHQTKEISVALQNEQTLGGVEKMIPLSLGDFVFINRSYFADTIYSAPNSSLAFTPSTTALINEVDNMQFNKQDLDKNISIIQSKNQFPETKYNPLKYMYRGLFLPLLAVNTMNLSDDILEATNLGLTFFTLDPTEKWQLISYSGYDFETQSFGTGFNFLNTTFPVHWGLGFNMDNYLTGKTIFTIKQDTSYTLHLRNNFSAFIFKNRAEYKTDMSIHQFYDLASLYFTNYRTVRKEYHATAGIQTGVHVENLYTSSSNQHQYEIIYFFNFALPTLLFFPNPANLTLNIPAKFQFQFQRKQFSFKTTAVIFSAEIQKSLPFFPLYFNRFTLNTSYSNTSLYDLSLFRHAVEGSAYFTITPIIGILTTMHFDVGLTTQYQIQSNILKFSFYGAFRM